MIDPSARAEATSIIIATAREFHTHGWMWGTSGNLSIRLGVEPLAFLVTASGGDKGALTASDTCLVGANGAAMEEWSGIPSAETPVHERIYRRCAAGAVYHVHTVAAAVVSDVFWPRRAVELEGLEMLKGIGAGHPHARTRIPIADNHADSNVIADLLEEAMEPDVPGVLIRNHGLYAWGDTPAEARTHVEIFEWLFSYVVQRAQWPPPPRP